MADSDNEELLKAAEDLKDVLAEVNSKFESMELPSAENFKNVQEVASSSFEKVLMKVEERED